MIVMTSLGHHPFNIIFRAKQKKMFFSNRVIFTSKLSRKSLQPTYFLYFIPSFKTSDVFGILDSFFFSSPSSYDDEKSFLFGSDVVCLTIMTRTTNIHMPHWVLGVCVCVNIMIFCCSFFSKRKRNQELFFLFAEI